VEVEVVQSWPTVQAPFPAPHKQPPAGAATVARHAGILDDEPGRGNPGNGSAKSKKEYKRRFIWFPLLKN